MIALPTLLLGPPRRTVAVAESLTAGHVQARIAAVSGASNYFLGGVTAYSLAQKVKLLGVDRVHAERVNSVSSDVAEQMARGACTLFGADVGVATTGYAEPSAVDGVLVPFAWWAVTRRGEGGRFVFRHGRIECPGASRIETQAMVAEAAIAELTAFLREVRK
jgi:nicotinamide-nucleotide amidase